MTIFDVGRSESCTPYSILCEVRAGLSTTVRAGRGAAMCRTHRLFDGTTTVAVVFSSEVVVVVVCGGGKQYAYEYPHICLCHSPLSCDKRGPGPRSYNIYTYIYSYHINISIHTGILMTMWYVYIQSKALDSIKHYKYRLLHNILYVMLT